MKEVTFVFCLFHDGVCQDFILGYVENEIFIISPSRTLNQGGSGYTRELCEFWTGDIYLIVIDTEMVFKVMGLNEITQG